MKVCGQILVLAKFGKAMIKNFLESQLIQLITIDHNLKFNHILSQCKKAGGKLSVLTKICKFMSLRRGRVLMKSFIESQFEYCPLVWMCCDKTSDNRINHLHERALRTVYNDNVSTFEKLLFYRHCPCNLCQPYFQRSGYI